MTRILPFLLSLYLSFNYNHGSILELSDGSRWEINPSDTTMTSLWLVPMELEISQSKDTTYPYLLDNLQTKQQVKAKKM